MTNEELVYSIQQGDAEKIICLWEQTEKFIIKQASIFLSNTSFSGDLLEDLCQSGYLALVTAAARYDPEHGASFIHYLSFYLYAEFKKALGLTTEKQAKDPLNTARSLYEPLKDSEGDSLMLFDTIGEDSSEIEKAENELYIDSLRAILSKEIERLPDQEAIAIKEYYWNDKTYKEIADAEGCAIEQIRQRKAKGIRKIRQRSRKSGLSEYVEDRTPYYKNTGLTFYKNTGISSVEAAILKRERLEKSDRA